MNLENRAFLGALVIIAVLAVGVGYARKPVPQHDAASAREEALAGTPPVFLKPSFKKVFVVVLENTDAEKALQQQYLKSLADRGAYLENFFSITHPSQPNYIAMTAGALHRVKDNDNHTLNVRSIADLLEAKHKTWKEYVEDFPGNCFLGAKSGGYTRKHAPFISYKSIQADPKRCANIVNAKQLDKDIAAGTLPDYALYVPNVANDGHDTDVGYASRWLEQAFGPRLKNPAFMHGMLFVVTFDEAEKDSNRIYTVLYGDSIIPGTVSKVRYDFYSLLRTIEETFGLGTLGKEDAKASPIAGIWK